MTDLVLSPMVTVILNILASALVSKGVIDEASRDTLVQLANNILAGLITVVVALFSIHKIVDLKKHEVTSNATTQSNASGTTTTISVPVATQENNSAIDLTTSTNPVSETPPTPQP